MPHHWIVSERESSGSTPFPTGDWRPFNQSSLLTGSHSSPWISNSISRTKIYWWEATCLTGKESCPAVRYERLMPKGLKQRLCSPICVFGFLMSGSRRRFPLHGHEMFLIFIGFLIFATCNWLLCPSGVQSQCKIEPLWLGLRSVPFFQKLSPQQWGPCCF